MLFNINYLCKVSFCCSNFLFILFLALDLAIHQDIITISAMIERSPFVALPFLLSSLVSHIEVVAMFLIILSRNIKSCAKFIFVSCICFFYILAILITIFIPVTKHETIHTFFAFLGFMGASISCVTLELSHWIFELTYFFLLSTLALVFWFDNNALAEYFFVLCLLCEKPLKIMFFYDQKIVKLNVDFEKEATKEEVQSNFSF